MTAQRGDLDATPPGPHLRDQLAEELAGDWGDERFEIADALMPVIAAEVQRQVQAAANQKAAEVLSYLRGRPDEHAHGWDDALRFVANELLAEALTAATCPQWHRDSDGWCIDERPHLAARSSASASDGAAG